MLEKKELNDFYLVLWGVLCGGSTERVNSGCLYQRMSKCVCDVVTLVQAGCSSTDTCRDLFLKRSKVRKYFSEV